MAGLQTLFGAKSLPFVVAALFLVPGFVLGSQYAYYEEVPTWQVGDTWTYRASFTAVETFTDGNGDLLGSESESQSDSESETFTLKVVSDDETVNGNPVYRLAVYQGGRKSDAGYISKATLNPLFPKMSFDPATGEMKDEGTEEIPLFSWPLTPGKSWTYTIPDFAVITFSTASRDFINVGGSTLNAVRVEARVTEVLNEQILKEIQEGRLKADFAVDYWYAEAVRNIARTEVRFNGEYTAETGESGTLSLTGVLELVGGEGLTEETPDGATLAGIDSLLIEAPASLNFADGKAATFKAIAEGTLPQGAKYVWNIDGERYEGDSAKAMFTTPGLKEVSLSLVGTDGALLAETSTLYEVYWKKDLTGTHALTGSDFAEAFPASIGGIYTITYAADGVPTSDENDDLTLLDPSGEEVDAGRELEGSIYMPGEYTVAISSEPLEYVNSAWTATVEVRYPMEWSTDVGELSVGTPVPPVVKEFGATAAGKAGKATPTPTAWRPLLEGFLHRV